MLSASCTIASIASLYGHFAPTYPSQTRSLLLFSITYDTVHVIRPRVEILTSTRPCRRPRRTNGQRKWARSWRLNVWCKLPHRFCCPIVPHATFAWLRFFVSYFYIIWIFSLIFPWVAELVRFQDETFRMHVLENFRYLMTIPAKYGGEICWSFDFAVDSRFDFQIAIHGNVANRLDMHTGT